MGRSIFRLLTETYRAICVFTVVAFLLAGVMFSVIFPPFQVADEDSHWITALRLTEQVLAIAGLREPVECSAGVALAHSIDINRLRSGPSVKVAPDDLRKARDAKPTCAAPHQFVARSNILSYAGMLPARVIVRNEINDVSRAILVLYLARIFQGFIVVLLMTRFLFLMIKNRETLLFGSLSLFLFCLAPIFVNQSFGVTYDSAVLAFVLSAGGLLLFRGLSSRLDLMIFTVCGIGACSAKPVLLPLGLAALLSLFIMQRFSPVSSEDSRVDSNDTDGAEGTEVLEPRGYGPLALILSATLIIAVSLFIAIQDVGHVNNQHPPTGVDPSYNKDFLLEDWGRAFRIVWQSVTPYLHLGYMATPLGLTNVSISSENIDTWRQLLLFGLTLDLLLIFACSVYKGKLLGYRRFFQGLGVSLLASLVLLLSLFAFLMLTGIGMYVLWTPKDNLGVGGLQNRYFLPFFLYLYIAAQLAVGGGIGFLKPRVLLMQDQGKRVWLDLSPWLISGLFFTVCLLPFVVAVGLDVLMRFY